MNKQTILFIGVVILLSAAVLAAGNSTETTITSTTIGNATTTTGINATTTLANATTTTGLPTTITAANLTTTTIEATTTTTSSTTTTTLACNSTRCDTGCAVCSDSLCHETGFVCREELSIEKIFPANISIGVTQINIIVRNTGNVGLSNISADLSGDGIRTLQKIPLAALAIGEKDYTFTKINATKAGAIDLVVKLIVNKQLKGTQVSLLNVIRETQAASNTTTEVLNITALSDSIKTLQDKYYALEQNYQEKKMQGYQVDLVPDSLKGADDSIKNAKVALLEGDPKKAVTGINLAEENLNTATNLLGNAQKPTETFGDKIKSNLILIGSIAAALISIFTAYGLIKNHINKQKIQDIQQKIKAKSQKIDEHEEIIEQHEEKLEEQGKKLEETEKKLDKLEEEEKK